ncbi:MAG: serine/threonine-protein kinase [Acidobacteriota bacterium]
MATWSTPSTQGSAAFFQHRVALFGLLSGLLSAAFLACSLVILLLIDPAQVIRPSSGFHALAIVFLLGIWWLCRKTERSRRFVTCVEATGVIGACIAYQLMGASIPAVVRPDLIMILALSFALIARAVFVPVPARNNFLFGLAVGLPLVVVSWWIFRQTTPELAALVSSEVGPTTRNQLALFVAINTAVWWMLATCLGAAASHVIYGLRVEVKEAQRLGQYVLERKLGEGGMGVVHLARHALLRRPTAIKLVSRSAGCADALARFEKEVQLTASLSHPNTVRIFDYGRTPEGVFYYAMEMLEGVTLKELVEAEGPLPPARVIHVLHQVAGALAEAHEAGLVHRDVKPGNIMLCRHGGVPDIAKVLDFGLVKEVDDESSVTLTNAGSILGTPEYLPPEVMTNPDSVDARSDLYALGVTAWYLLVGEPLFAGRTAMEVCSHHLQSTPDRPSVRTDRPVPLDLEDLVMACLEKKPDRRPASARELRRGLAVCEGFGTWCEDEGLACQSRELAAVAKRKREGGQQISEQTTRAVSADEISPVRLTVELDARSLGR